MTLSEFPKNGQQLNNLVLILGDQLDHQSGVFKKFDKQTDAIAMVEVINESQVFWSHKVRTVFFLSSMRHFAAELIKKDFKVYYQKIDDPDAESDFQRSFKKIIQKVNPKKLIVSEPGEHRVLEELKKLAESMNLILEVIPDESFFCTTDEFKAYAKAHKSLRMEYFYRELRRKNDILMNGQDPEGNQWNFDKENRKSFGKTGPAKSRNIVSPPDEITLEVISLVKNILPSNPGNLDYFAWPVDEKSAKSILDAFIDEKLPHFGDWQDAMWEGEPFLFHSKISAAMNVKILSPRYVVKRVEDAYRKGHVPLASAEGFIRQILGWREYVRGVYFLLMPDYLQRNFLNAHKALPAFYWTGKTHMNCISKVVRQTLDHGYAHHIQRLMVTGLFALLYGVDPKKVHEWYLAVYIDAIEWVELPNTLGMSQYADGGVMASKPYIASGKYIDRMSNYCKGCRYNPDAATGENACPFTILYWDFVNRHQSILRKNPRLGMQVKNWDKKDQSEKEEITQMARKLRSYTKDV